ncbi:MAG: glycosyltransferase family 2 protein [Terricaulis sp.]
MRLRAFGMDGAEAGAVGRTITVSVDAAALEDARLGLHRRAPHRSAKRVFYFTQIVAFAALGVGLWLASMRAPGATLSALHVTAIVLFAIIIAWRLAAAANLNPPLTRLSAASECPVYTILCPIYREASGVADLVAAIERLDYPREAIDLKLLVEGDDTETLEAALNVASVGPVEVVIIPPSAPRTKPKALNVGLTLARGAYVTVYDAEDRPHPQQLRAALAAFEDGAPSLVCVQAPLAIDNGDEAWIARQFAAEYDIQFREMLPLLARAGLPLPLGGSSNHFKIAHLRAVGGWDAWNVTEDADLGYRFAREGMITGVIAPPTWEEAPITLRAWHRQRTRWIKGHLQTWLVLMRDPLRTLHEMGLAAFAAMQITLLGGVVAALAHAPLALMVLTAMFTSYDLTPVDFVLALCGYGVAFFAVLSACALSRSPAPLRAALTMPFYWPLLLYPAIRAVLELFLAPHAWAKTAHGVSARTNRLASSAPAAASPRAAAPDGFAQSASPSQPTHRDRPV